MVSPSNSSRKKSAAITTSFVSFSLACQTCIKNNATKVALMVAIPRATAALYRPRSSVAAYTVRPVPTSNAKNTPKYIFKGDDVADECSDMQASWVPVDQVKQREQVNPDDVNEVPVEAADLDWSVPLGSETSLPGHDQEPEKNAEADDHVQCVQAGHDEVEGEEKLRVVRVCALTGMPGDRHIIKAERRARDVMLDKLVVVLDSFDAEKDQAEDDSDTEAADQQITAGGLRGPDCENHG